MNFVLIPWASAVIAAAAAAPLGGIIAWRRLIYFGEALAHASWLGIALALWLNIPLYLGIWATTLLMIILLILLRSRGTDDGNNILGTLSHLMLALGVIALSQMENIRTDLFGYLFGDILNTTANDLIIISIAAIVVLVALIKLWQPLIMLTVCEDIARTETPHIQRYEALFLLLLGGFVGIMMQLLGLILVMAFLIIPIQTANRFAHTPEQCACFAALIAAISATLGVGLAFLANYPVAPAIVAISGGFYFLAQVINLIKIRKNH
ncbi:metal ABC transporter permease [Suttonella ornithocola]|uniref:metal ABC transporter permease n=1 Tax=Suttonella ornithocola TaxID=279832 RepID=UPI001FEBE0C6|nr:metal ABC transporter permease [Suttonella ornithocola]